MRRFGAIGFISAYLLALTWGNVSHTLGYKNVSHPAMYFLVWDMFCGWTAYESELHLIAEGQSEKYYELTPPPWGTFRPWGRHGRWNYDMSLSHHGRFAKNVLNHTQHEPMTRIFVVEESWSKKYDLPPTVFKMRFGDEPQEPRYYHGVLAEILPCGTYVRKYPRFIEAVGMSCVTQNPRLVSEMRASQPMFLANPNQVGREFEVGLDGVPANVAGFGSAGGPTSISAGNGN